ncbi:hypothetical protein AKJ48_02905 [candidate division MSBL1 archaeon SCGC-AAA261O19]|uniref:Uncharacterized protein n=2 Tax=candidate division MSBL1 TaxID=215777 RepID=A0A133UZU2_9EURY|nr:hypothetical protein AKJ42_02705 [candidate division MSBL1 archaeon SCGC-AAA261C02]KXB04353.1 hypothetical protein AKJ48_02905 [candidate division MSBL1 archaeon SCGC-AAA261O19]
MNFANRLGQTLYKGGSLFTRIRRTEFGWTEVIMPMGKCCICGGLGVFLAYGKWWCTRHYDLASNELRVLPCSRPEDEAEVQTAARLGLRKL